MPSRPMRTCSHPGCPALVKVGTRYCDNHQIAHDKFRNKHDQAVRPDYHAWYNSNRWRQSRVHFLQLHPLCECEDCRRLNRLLSATIVDHKIPHKGNYNLFWDTSNWQAMAKSCHDRKSAKEDGGFGNRKINRH
jgi:5-methylcytosine-specific restriction protein A